MERYDVAVVGLGALGSGAAYQAAVKGARVIGFEQFELGHVRGASHDTSRIVRTSYGSPEFVGLARSAYRDWADLEKRSGLNLLDITGGVVFLPQGGPTPSSDFTKSLGANGVLYELLDSREVNRRWPGFNFSRWDRCRAVTTMQYQARAHGAVLREKTCVDQVIPDGDGVLLETSKGQVRADKVILAADAWINKLLRPLGAEIPLTVMQEQVTYFKPADPALFEPERFPVWIWGGEKWFYGFPTYGEPTIKAGQDAQQNLMAPETRTFVPSPEVFQTLKDHMDVIIPGHGQDVRTVTCPIQRHPNIFIALSNGLAFKFAPAIGRVAAELAIDGKTSDDITKFPVPTPAGPSKL
ncbi:hypothetical protein BDW72DRAFT_205717 [Aspergillus terricola var. indicus]